MIVALTPCSDWLTTFSIRSSHGVLEYMCGEGNHMRSSVGCQVHFPPILEGCEMGGKGVVHSKEYLASRDDGRGRKCLEAEQQKNFPKISRKSPMNHMRMEKS